MVYSRRVKYLAMSSLTPDYLDTTGRLNTIEGEFSNDLISLITVMGQFGLQGETNVSTDIGSTFIPPVRSGFETEIDHKTRFMQYVRTHNDRASYSLACILDGVCPVNFQDQVNAGK